MVLWGSLINALAILLGTVIGIRIPFSEGIRVTVMQGLSLAVIIIGINMGLESQNILIPIASLVLGGALGEYLRLEERIASIGTSFSRVFRGEQGRFTQGFLTATLVYCIGAMAILGAIDSGLTRSHNILYAKSMLDGVSAIFFASSFGIGVAFSAVPVLLYQGTISLLATYMAPFLSGSVIMELTATGGILILGIGINVLNMAKIPVGNFLPSLGFAVLLSLLF